MKIVSQTYSAAFIDFVFVIVTSNVSRNNVKSIKLTRLCDILAIFTAKKNKFFDDVLFFAQKYR